jgi:hypothetical protein
VSYVTIDRLALLRRSSLDGDVIISDQVASSSATQPLHWFKVSKIAQTRLE